MGKNSLIYTQKMGVGDFYFYASRDKVGANLCEFKRGCGGGDWNFTKNSRKIYFIWLKSFDKIDESTYNVTM